MTPQEAIKFLEETKVGCKFTSDKQLFDVCSLAISAIKKQIPKKPTVNPANLCDFQNYHCPTCNKKIVSRLDGVWIAGKPQSHCDDCGQALEWA